MNAQFAYQYLIGQGLPAHVAAGIVDNLVVESGNFAADVLSGARRGDNGQAAFVQQLRGNRLTNFEQWAAANGRPATDLTAQLDFILEEMNPRSPYRDGIAASNRDRIVNAPTREDAARAFARHYERPNAATIPARINAAQISTQTAQGRPTPVPSARPAAASPDLPRRTIPVNRAMNPLLASRQGASRLTSPEAVNVAADVLSGPYEQARQYFKMATGRDQLPPINDMIAKRGTSRERNTPNSQHFRGRAMDLSTRGLNNRELIALNEALDLAGFKGRGYGANIIHADTRETPGGWSYGNSQFAGRDVSDFVTSARDANLPDDLRITGPMPGVPTPTQRPAPPMLPPTYDAMSAPNSAPILPPQVADPMDPHSPVFMRPQPKAPLMVQDAPAPAQVAQAPAPANPMLPPLVDRGFVRTVPATPIQSTPPVATASAFPAAPSAPAASSNLGSGLGSVFAGIASAIAAGQQARAQAEAQAQAQWQEAYARTLGDNRQALAKMPVDVRGRELAAPDPRPLDTDPVGIARSPEEILASLFGRPTTIYG